MGISHAVADFVIGNHEVSHIKLRPRETDLLSPFLWAVCAVVVAQKSRRRSSGLGSLLVLPRTSTQTLTLRYQRRKLSEAFGQFSAAVQRIGHTAIVKCVVAIPAPQS